MGLHSTLLVNFAEGSIMYAINIHFLKSEAMYTQIRACLFGMRTSIPLPLPLPDFVDLLITLQQN